MTGISVLSKQISTLVRVDIRFFVLVLLITQADVDGPRRLAVPMEATFLGASVSFVCLSLVIFTGRCIMTLDPRHCLRQFSSILRDGVHCLVINHVWGFMVYSSVTSHLVTLVSSSPQLLSLPASFYLPQILDGTSEPFPFSPCIMDHFLAQLPSYSSSTCRC